MEEKRESSRDLEHLPPLQTLTTEESNADTVLWVLDLVCHEFVEPLFDENAKRCGNETGSETERPECVHDDRGALSHK